jgi:hypothetical protein|tara:strand:- start:30 stop:716 length:687 start_codon:yes stop_codon:yes gene_type:complete
VNYQEILPAIQVMTPEQTLLAFCYFVNADDKFEPETPAQYKAKLFIEEQHAKKVELQLDNFWLEIKDKLKEQNPNKKPSDYKLNPLPWRWVDKDDGSKEADDIAKLGLDKAFFIKVKRPAYKTDKQGNKRPNTPPILFDSSCKKNNGKLIPLSDEDKQQYIKIGAGSTAQVGIWARPYSNVSTGVSLTIAAVNIKNFIPYQNGVDWGFTVDEAQQAGSGTPSTNDFDF